MYQPLPRQTTIAMSEIHGHGIFAVEDIPVDTKLGPSHFEYGQWFLRLPFGGFINFSHEPNCERRREGEFWYVYPLRDLEVGEELTLLYVDYDPTISRIEGKN